MKKIAILGPGGVGGFLAAVFWKSGFEVICIAKEESAKLISRNGIRLESGKFGNFTAHPSAKSELDYVPDVIFITVKGYSLEDSMKRIDRKFISKDTIVIPLLNGLDHMEMLKRNYGSAVVAGTISIEAFQSDSGSVIHKSSFARIKVASDLPAMREKLENLSSALSESGIEVSVGSGEAQILWEKLVRLSALSSLTALTGKPIGFLRSDAEWRSKLEKSIIEAAAVAKKDGAAIDPADSMKHIDSIDPNQMSSLQRDISSGNRSELEYITGTILRKADFYGIPCPTIREVFSELSLKAL